MNYNFSHIFKMMIPLEDKRKEAQFNDVENVNTFDNFEKFSAKRLTQNAY